MCIFTAPYRRFGRHTARVGECLLNKDSATTWNRHYYRIKGNRHYELTNHLGNVLAVVTDRKMAKDTTADGTYTPQFFMPDVYSVQNYYAFGQSMPGWSGTAAVNDPKKYRFGYNGKEDDDEWGKQDYGFRISDPRIGRFLSVDPLATSYPWNSCYAFAENDVIRSIDIEGLEKAIVVNNYSDKRLSSVTIFRVSNGGIGGNPVNFDAQGNSLRALTLNDILVINRGSLPDNKKQFDIKTDLEIDENSIIGAGPDINRSLRYNGGTNSSDNMDNLYNFSFPNLRPNSKQPLLTLEIYQGSYTTKPVFTEKIQEVKVPHKVNFPSKKVGAIGPLDGRIQKNPTNLAGFQELKGLFGMATENNINSINVEIGMSLGSNINVSALKEKIEKNLKSEFNYNGSINLSLNSGVSESQGYVRVSSPNATITEYRTEKKKVQVQTGTQEVLNPN
jgi:RHS repeat-associated protein